MAYLNAVSGKCYDDPELLTINTLENAIYLSMKNDISFLIDSGLSLYEHQSTFNPNMPLRFLFYLSDLYSSAVKDKNLYGTRVVPVPAPRFIVFYNGREERPDRETIYLSDAYETKEAEVSLELKADIWNINRGHNKELMEACKTLQEYSEYVHRLRKNAEKFPIMDAVEKTIDECIRENILQEFLIKNRAEAKKVSIYEYNEEEHMRMEREDAFEDGLKAGIEKGREQLEAAEAEIKKLKEQLAAKKESINEYNKEEHMRMERKDVFGDGLKAGFEKGREQLYAAEQRADTAEKRAEAAERRAAEAEAELRKIKEQLAVKK